VRLVRSDRGRQRRLEGGVHWRPDLVIGQAVQGEAKGFGGMDRGLVARAADTRCHMKRRLIRVANQRRTRRVTASVEWRQREPDVVTQVVRLHLGVRQEGTGVAGARGGIVTLATYHKHPPVHLVHHRCRPCARRRDRCAGVPFASARHLPQVKPLHGSRRVVSCLGGVGIARRVAPAGKHHVAPHQQPRLEVVAVEARLRWQRCPIAAIRLEPAEALVGARAVRAQVALGGALGDVEGPLIEHHARGTALMRHRDRTVRSQPVRRRVENDDIVDRVLSHLRVRVVPRAGP